MSILRASLDSIFETQTLNLAPLTILTGYNNTGKTTILKHIYGLYPLKQDFTRYFKWKECFTALSDIEHNIPNNGLIILEQPECGLHPSLQLEMADKIIKVMNQSLITVVETHSDHIINRLIRRHIEGIINDKDITIYHLTRKSSKNKTQINQIIIDREAGVINDQDFFCQFAKETENIIKACLKNTRLNKKEKK